MFNICRFSRSTLNPFSKIALAILFALPSCNNLQEAQNGDLSGDLIPYLPKISILEPKTGSQFAFGETIVFKAKIEDDKDDPEKIRLQWSSDKTGIFSSQGSDVEGNAAAESRSLSPEKHIIELMATNSEGLSSVASVTISIQLSPDAPIISIQPAKPSTTDRLVASLDNRPVTDYEGNFLLEWSRNGQIVDTGAFDIEPSLSKRGEIWGLKISLEKEEGTFTSPGYAQVTIHNTPPECQKAIFADIDGSAEKSCLCIGRSDPDRDARQDLCRISINGVQGEPGSCKVNPQAVPPGTSIGCSYIPRDDTDSGKTVSALRMTTGKPVAATQLNLAPNLNLEEADYTVNEKTGKVTVKSTLVLNQNSSISTHGDDTNGDSGTSDIQIIEINLQVTGTYAPDGSYQLDLSLPPDEKWDPFGPKLPLEISNVTGELYQDMSAIGGQLDIYLKGEVAGDVTVAPGLILENVTVSGTIDLAGNWVTRIEGESVVDLGADARYRIAVRGSFDAEDNLILTGIVNGDFAPFEAVLGQNLFWVKATDLNPFLIHLKVNTASKEFVTDIELPLRICSDGNCTLTSGNGLDINAKGSYASQGDYSLSLELADGQQWDPFDPIFPLRFERISGTLSRSSGIVGVSLIGEVGGNLEVIPGLTLTQAGAAGSIDSNKKWNAELFGTTTVDLGDGQQRSITVRGSLNSAKIFALAGEVAGNLEPLQELIGPGRFVVAGSADQPFALTVMADLSTKSYALAMDAPMTFCVQHGCLGDEAIRSFVHAEGQLQGGKLKGYFAGSLDGVDLGPIGVLDGVAFIAATDQIADVDILNNGEIIRTLPRGITMGVTARLPEPVDIFAQSTTMLVSIQGTTSLRIEGDLGMTIPIITPEHQVPSIEHLTMTRVYFFTEFSATQVALGIGSESELQPTNQSDPLNGVVELSVAPGPGNVEFLGLANLTGLWIEPFFLRDFAIQNPGLTLALKITPSPTGVAVVPSSLGWNYDVFWKKEMEWPNQLPPEVDLAPDHILAVGSTFYYNLNPKESCIAVVCIPIPQLSIRMNLENLTMDNMTKVTNDISAAIREPFEAILPAEEIQPLQNPPVTIDIKAMRAVVSTHTHKVLNQPFEAGFRVLLDTTINGKNTFFEGAMGENGLLLHASQDSLEFPGLALVGDPFWREVNLKGGWVEIPSDPALQPTKGMMEAWINKDSWPDTALVEVVNKMDGSNGYILGVGQPEVVKCEDFGSDEFSCRQHPFCVWSGQSCLNGTSAGKKGRIILKIFNNGLQQNLITEAVVMENQDVHLAWQFDLGLKNIDLFDPSDDDPPYRVYLNGALQNLQDTLGIIDTAQAADPGNSGDGSFLLPGVPNNAPFIFGHGMDKIDDIRIWNSHRTMDQITAHSRNLPNNYINQFGASNDSSPLLARYEFDWDTTGSKVNNSQVYAKTATIREPKYDGLLTGRAQVVFNSSANPMEFLVQLSPPWSGPSAFGVIAGFLWEIDINNTDFANIKMGVHGVLNADAAQLEFVASPVPFMPIGLPGTPHYQGLLYLSGFGPNLMDDDNSVDDGLYGSLDFGNSSFSGTGLIEWRAANGDLKQRFMDAAFVYVDHGSQGRYLGIDANMAFKLVFDLGKGTSGDFDINGSVRFNKNTPPNTLIVEGSVNIYGQSFGDMDNKKVLEISQTMASFSDTWRGEISTNIIPAEYQNGLDTASWSTIYTFDFVTATFCGKATPSVSTAAGDLSCSLETCFAPGKAPVAKGECNQDAYNCGDDICSGTFETCLTCSDDCSGGCADGDFCLYDSDCSNLCQNIMEGTPGTCGSAACGDLECNGLENCLTCPGDCNDCCALDTDGIMNYPENLGTLRITATNTKDDPVTPLNECLAIQAKGTSTIDGFSIPDVPTVRCCTTGLPCGTLEYSSCAATTGGDCVGGFVGWPPVWDNCSSRTAVVCWPGTVNKYGCITFFQGWATPDVPGWIDEVDVDIDISQGLACADTSAIQTRYESYIQAVEDYNDAVAPVNTAIDSYNALPIDDLAKITTFDIISKIPPARMCTGYTPPGD